MNSSGNLTILFVAFEFPPLNSGGVQRSLKWVKYLPDFGINPVVITIEVDDIGQVFRDAKTDNGLLVDIPENTIIKRVHCESPSQSRNKIWNWLSIYFSVSEIFKKTWKKNLEISLPEIMATYKPDAVYVTLPPFAMATLWRKLLRRYDIPLIVDFRDAWSQWCVNVNGSYFHYLAKLLAERKILKRADAVVCSSTQIMLDMQNVHPMIDGGKYTVITNGFDEDEIPQLVNLETKKNKIVIGYVGSFYYTPEYRDNIFRPWWKKPIHRMLNYVPRKEDWLYRSPFYFFMTIQSILDKHQDWKETVEIRFAGSTPKWLIDQIKAFGLENNCRHYGHLNHDDVISFQKGCDALLITSSKVIDGRDYSIAGKTFEYFTIGKPILAFVCDGVQKDLLQQSGSAVMFNPDDNKQSVTTMLQFFNGNIKLNPDMSFIKQHHRKNLTKKLAGVIREITTKNL